MVEVDEAVPFKAMKSDDGVPLNIPISRVQIHGKIFREIRRDGVLVRSKKEGEPVNFYVDSDLHKGFRMKAHGKNGLKMLFTMSTGVLDFIWQ